MQHMFSQEKGQPASDRSASEAQGLKARTLEHTTEFRSLFRTEQRPQKP